MEISFAGRVAIVTGGGRGIGRAHCLEFARRGAAVVVNDLTDPDRDGTNPADEVVKEIQSAGGQAVACHDSVVTKDGSRRIVQTALDHFGTVDIIVNNAGVMRNGYFEEITPEKLDLVLDVNLRGSYFVTQAAWATLRDKGYGRVIMTSSSGGLFSQHGMSNYAAAKAGVYGLAKAIAFEGRPHGINVNVVLPMAGHMHAMDPVPDAEKYYPPRLREKLEPLRRVEASTPMVAFLASENCNLTGEAFAAGFGRFARVFVGESRGWVAPVLTISAEDVAAHIADVRELDGFAIPGNLFEELELASTQLDLFTEA